MEFLQKYYKDALLILIIIFLLGIILLNIYIAFFKENGTSNEPLNLEIIEPNEQDTNEEIKMYAEIKGEVNKPGVYAITKNTIINDLVNLAGGFKKGAYTKNINLSKKVQNEMVIMVYSAYEYSKLSAPQIIYIEKECNCPSYDLSSCLNDGNSVIKPSEDNSDSNANKDNTENNNESSGVININTATEKELMSLPGIGESKAKAIIDYRNKNGNFTTSKDIMKVSGISEKIYEGLKDSITV